jgi:hypothetical protein
MHYVKQFHINGVDTKQVACIELQGKPNAATEGCVGVLGIDMTSPLHDVYKCVAKNGSIYTWELLSSGLSIMSSTITGGGEDTVQFPYANLRTPAMYVVKIGDLILDIDGYLYQVSSLNSTYCVATYCGTQIRAQAHKHSASEITAGTFAGQVVANSAGQTPTTSLLRNSRLVLEITDPTVEGEICWLYE